MVEGVLDRRPHHRLEYACPVNDTHRALLMRVQKTESMFDHDVCTFFDLIMRIVPQIDATTIVQPA